MIVLLPGVNGETLLPLHNLVIIWLGDVLKVHVLDLLVGGDRRGCLVRRFGLLERRRVDDREASRKARRALGRPREGAFGVRPGSVLLILISWGKFR